MQSPPKRRKTSGTTGIAVGASQSLEPRSGGAPPSSRPSFQSPTRSSLARFHPDVLERALSRSPTRRPRISGGQDDPSGQAESQTFGLRDRKALRPSLNATTSPLTRPRLSSDAPMLSPSRRASGIQSFAQPPRRVSKKIGSVDLFGSPIGKQIRPTEEIHSHTPEDQLASELDRATSAGQVDVGLDGAGDFVDEDPLEPDLPPTPTQLGLEKAPDRPRELWSSSPSVRRESRIKRKAADPSKGSPLKSLKFQRLRPVEDQSDEEPAGRQDGLAAAVIEKRKLRKNLSTELRRLKDDVAELEKWARKGEDLEADAEGLDKLLALLTSEEASHITYPEPQPAPISISSLLSTLLPFCANVPRPPRPTSPSPTNPFALQETSESRAYLTVFAPLSLKTCTSRTSSSKTTPLSETHTLNFTAPSPFPTNLYNVTVVYEANPETQSLTSVSVPTGSDTKKKQRVPTVLRRWIDSRLTNPLLKLDVATLCWGINRYWEATVSRARLWARIEQQYGNVSSTRASKATSAHEDGTLTLRHLIPHLERSTMVITSKSPSTPRVLLSNTLTMDDWTGEPHLHPDINVSALSAGSDASKKINQEVKKLFNALLHEKDGSLPQGLEGGVHVDAILRVTEGALGALFGNV